MFKLISKDYDPASAALDAYIADFERSQNHSGLLTGRIVLPQTPAPTWSRHSTRTLRNKDGGALLALDNHCSLGKCVVQKV